MEYDGVVDNLAVSLLQINEFDSWQDAFFLKKIWTLLNLYDSHHPPNQREKLSKRLCGNLTCKDKNFSWLLIGFPYGISIGSTLCDVGEKPTVILYTYINRHHDAGTPEKQRQSRYIKTETEAHEEPRYNSAMLFKEKSERILTFWASPYIGSGIGLTGSSRQGEEKWRQYFLDETVTRL